jgi:predicted AAA+ superfamily ATPase
MYLNRTIEKRVNDISTHFPVLVVTGARQTGKTTLLRHLASENRRYITLDDPLILELARNDPALFMQIYSGPVLIDEIQYAPELLPYIKMAVDENRTPGRFWLTGSQRFHMMNNISESLAGRVGIVSLLGLSRRELFGQGLNHPEFLPDPSLVTKKDEEPLPFHELYRLIWRGSFPALAQDGDLNRTEFLSSYVDSYLKRDVRDLAQAVDEVAFTRFMRACAARTGQLLNIDELSRDADISPVTGKKWLSVLEASGMIFLLEPYFTNIAKRLVKSPKLYFLDTGLASFLTGWPSPETLEMGAMSGAIFETWVMCELLKNWLGNVPQPPFYYYRDKDKVEIDLLIIQGNIIYPLEIKKTASPKKNDIRHFKALEQLKMTIGPGGVICLTTQVLPLTENAWAIPVGLI